MPTAQVKAARAQALAEGRGQAIAGIGQDQSEAYAQRPDAIDLLKGDLRLGARRLERLWYTGGDHAFDMPV